MTKHIHKGGPKAVKAIVQKARVGRLSHVMKPESLALVENFRLMDDTFLSKCFENAPECIELILQIILDKKDLQVVTSQTEYPIKNLQGRGVRFDVFARDSEGREYDIEIQRADKGADPKRARYNSALLDANALKSGADFTKLRDTYVIIITENDVMGRGQGVYVFDRVDKKSGLDLGDGAHVVYANGMWRGDDALGRLMYDFNCRDADKMHYDVLKKRVSQLKDSQEGRHIMCKAVEEYAERRAAESERKGKREGRRETMLAMAKRLIANGKLMLKEIAECTGLSLAQVKKLQAEMA